jgi:hypothetical protein
MVAPRRGKGRVSLWQRNAVLGMLQGLGLVPAPQHVVDVVPRGGWSGHLPHLVTYPLKFPKVEGGALDTQKLSSGDASVIHWCHVCTAHQTACQLVAGKGWQHA